LIKSHSSRVVPAPPDEVYALIRDPAQRANLSLHPVELVSEEELPNGLRAAHLRMRLPKGGTVDTHTTTVELIANERIVFRTTVSPISFIRSPLLRSGVAETKSTITLEPHRDGTLLVSEREMQLKPLALRLFLTLFKRTAVQRQGDAALDRIRAQFLKWPTHRR
jgi:uncharacterized protein YndB with AHSA1/START domain